MVVEASSDQDYDRVLMMMKILLNFSPCSEHVAISSLSKT